MSCENTKIKKILHYYIKGIDIKLNVKQRYTITKGNNNIFLNSYTGNTCLLCFTTHREHTNRHPCYTHLLHTDIHRQRCPAYNEPVCTVHLYITLHNYEKTKGPARQDRTVLKRHCIMAFGGQLFVFNLADRGYYSPLVVHP